MKTEMRVKTGEWSIRDEGGSDRRAPQKKKKGDRLSVFFRGGACAALLMLLAIGGYAGARPQSVKTTAAPIAASAQIESAQGMSYDEILMRQENDRQEEIALLDSVIENELTDEATKKSALAQKADLAMRMETESALHAVLSHMGYDQAATLCGAGQITLIVPEAALAGEEDTLRIIDAAAAAAQVEAQNVKIILVKK